MRFKFYVDRVWGKSILEIACIVVGALERRAKRLKSRVDDLTCPSFMPPKRLPSGDWKWRIGNNAVMGYSDNLELTKLCGQYLDHQFDLLGSGLVCFNRQQKASKQRKGLFDNYGHWLDRYVTRPNRRQSRRIWHLIFEGPWAAVAYHPIDWHWDVKSDTHWDSKTWYMDVGIGTVPGADIKVPWEIARLQHLPQLAVHASLLNADGDRPNDIAKMCVVEIRAQILDFIACNPPRYGIHWRTPMEAAIRGANILLSLDILHSVGIVLDESTMLVIHDFIDAQTRHILTNLEWSERERGNHYYANVLGVLFAASYLPETEERQVWRAFAIHQLALETDRQFLDDGGNFEGSTSYHRLTLEMAIYALALVDGLTEDEFSLLGNYKRELLTVRPPFPIAPSKLYETSSGASPFSQGLRGKIYLGLLFLTDLGRPDQRFTQIGDTDSSRLFKLHPVMRANREDTVNAQGVIAAGAGLFEHIDDKVGLLDGKIVSQLAKGKRIRVEHSNITLPQISTFTSASGQFLKGYGQTSERESRNIRISGSIPLDRLVEARYPEFGIYLLRAPGFHLAIRCFDPATGGACGHAHDDNLAIELVINDVPLITDPGSFVYTADPNVRRLYRSAESHFVARAKHCPAVNEKSDLFSIEHLARGDCLYFGVEGFVGRLTGSNWTVERRVTVSSEGIDIMDFSRGADLEQLHVRYAQHMVTDGYGRETEYPICSL